MRWMLLERKVLIATLNARAAGAGWAWTEPAGQEGRSRAEAADAAYGSQSDSDLRQGWPGLICIQRAGHRMRIFF